MYKHRRLIVTLIAIVLVFALIMGVVAMVAQSFL